MQSRILIISLLLSVWSSSHGQFTDDWINFNQQYFKITVSETGLYRISAEELTAVGIAISQIPVNRFQIFHKGKQIAIHVDDADEDGVLNYLEFYGQKNDGSMDKDLYVSPDAQPHQYIGIFEDESYYFLTWTQVAGAAKRMELSTIQDATGLTAEPYHAGVEHLVLSSVYNEGLYYGASNEILSSLYDFGEGWTGAVFSGSKMYTLKLANAFITSVNPTAEIFIVGANNNNHRTRVSVGPSESALRTLSEVQFTRRYSRKINANLEWTDISASGEIFFKFEALGTNDRISVSSVKITFPQSFKMDSLQATYHVKASTAARAFLKVPSDNPSALMVFDVSDPENVKNLARTVLRDRIEFVYADPTTPRDILVVSAPKSIKSISKTTFTNYDFSNTDYLMVYHPSLDEEVSGVKPVQAYAQYRGSAMGGGHKVLMITIDQVYDQFAYGFRTPLGIRNLSRLAVQRGQGKFLFLIGKAFVTQRVGNFDIPNPRYSISESFVPTFGHPGADAPYSARINSDETPDLGTGRFSATSSQEVLNYLNKVKEMEALPFDDLWRKNILQLSGGQTLNEQIQYKNNIKSFESIAKGDYYGAVVKNLHKNSQDPTELINVATEVNKGVSLITFFGHSSAIVTDIEIGYASDPDAGYHNKSKYPVILMNGCNSGSAFSSSSKTFAEDWLNTPNVGAVSVIANSNFTLSSALKLWSDLFYQIAFAEDENFGKSLGDITRLVAARYFSFYGTDGPDYSQVYGTILQGDPAVKVFGAQKPDFTIEQSGITASSFDNQRVVSNLDSFQLHLPVKNFGKTTLQSFSIEVARTLVDGTTTRWKQSYDPVLHSDTLHFTVYNEVDQVNEGESSFQITLDPENEIPELSEVNNKVTYSLFVPRGNTINLLPEEEAMVSSRNLNLIWQSANLLEPTRGYKLQLDTSYKFNSPFLMDEEINGKVLLEYAVDLKSLPDSSTVYWRTRFSNFESAEDTSWVLSSFTVVDGGKSGWMQVDGHQFGQNEHTGVLFNETNNTMSFLETLTEVDVSTHGFKSVLEYGDYQMLVNGTDLLSTDNIADPECKRNTINAVIFDRSSALPYRTVVLNPSDVLDPLVCGRLPQMINNLTQDFLLNNSRRYLDSLISMMKNGDQILLFSIDSVAYSKWDDRLKNSLASVGISKATINSLVDGQPVIFLGKKGQSEGSAVEVINNGTTFPIKTQILSLSNTVSGKSSSGETKTFRVGPAARWHDFNYSVVADTNDIWAFQVNALTSTGVVQDVFAGQRTNRIDISQIDAKRYPFLNLSFFFSDNKDFTPPQLQNWSVAYDAPPEGVLLLPNPEVKELLEGQDYQQDFYFVNISDTAFSDSLNVNYQVTNLETNNPEEVSLKIPAPKAGDSTRIAIEVKSKGKVGENNLLMTVSPPDFERFTSNNVLNFQNAFSVTRDEVNPVLDVTFDGAYIMNGDIVAPSPLIMMLLKDENPYLLKEDTIGMKVELRSPCDGCDYERINFTDPFMSITPATETEPYKATYQPDRLENGVYGLRVTATDQSGNMSGLVPYEVTFEVINEASVTHFYPYPNPFSTSTRFVFTLTGSTIPERIKIQIMTISGRVVREITQDEIGPLKIGNNITQYAWDGRDEFGDLLANGVYFYKVFIETSGDALEHRFSSGDRAFKNGFGKIYILR